MRSVAGCIVIVSVKIQGDRLAEFGNRENGVVAAVVFQHGQIGIQIDAERTGAGRIEGILRISVILFMRNVQADFVNPSAEEFHPLRVHFLDLFAFDLRDIVLIGIVCEIIAEPVIVSLQCIRLAALILRQLIGSPACRSLQGRIVVARPKSGAGRRLLLALFIQILFHEREALEAVSGFIGKGSVLFQHIDRAVETNHQFVLAGAVESDILEGNAQVLILYQHIETALVKIRAIICLIDRFAAELVYRLACFPRSSLVVQGLILDGHILRAFVAVRVYIAFGVIEVPDIDIHVAVLRKRLIRCKSLGGNGSVNLLRLTVQILARVLHHDIHVIGRSAHIEEIGAELFFHRIDEITRINRRSVVPGQIIAKGDLPGIAARLFLLGGISPLCVHGGGYVLQLGCSGIFHFKSARNNRVRVDRAVRIELAARRFVKLVVVFKERADNITQDLPVVVVFIRQHVPVARHRRRIRTVGPFFQIRVRNRAVRSPCRSRAVRSPRRAARRPAATGSQERHRCHRRRQNGNSTPFLCHFIHPPIKSFRNRKSFIPAFPVFRFPDFPRPFPPGDFCGVFPLRGSRPSNNFSDRRNPLSFILSGKPNRLTAHRRIERFADRFFQIPGRTIYNIYIVSLCNLFCQLKRPPFLLQKSKSA